MSEGQSSTSTVTPATSEFHPTADLFPLMEESAFVKLADDIAANGLREPIWRHSGGRIIDGRNRWLACTKAGVECPHRTYEQGEESILGFVVSKNLHRRHLTTRQRAAIAADLATLAKGMKKADTAFAVSQPEAARLLGVSVDSVQRAAAVKRADPEMHRRVKAGEVTAGQARSATAAAAAPIPAPIPEPNQPDLASGSDEDIDDYQDPNDGARALAAITAVATLKFTGTAAATKWDWSDAEIELATKAANWLKMFTYAAARERDRRKLQP